jgi:valyl-tRNA synthetase
MALEEGAYNPQLTEAEILNFWLSNKFYKPEYNPSSNSVMSLEEMKADSREPFCIICPPPNAYGRPHLGNISGYAYQDLMGRYARMNGKKVLLLPGKDHAGLEGEGVFVREVLEKKGIYKFSLARDEFYKMIWDFNMQNKELALKDEKSIGLSADFDRDIFTLDPKIVNTVLSTFVDMYKQDMIYKGVRIVNWDPKAKTVIADNQCVREERDGKLHYIKYPIIKGNIWRLSFYNSQILENIKNGSKTIETRALNPEESNRYFGDIKVGDTILCINKSDSLINHIAKKVKGVNIYKSFEELFESNTLENILPSKPSSVEELRSIYAGLATDYDKKIDQNGLIAIELEDLNEFITVATTRPETMFGDTAVAVNPKDIRYKDLIGKKCIIPLTDIQIPIIESTRVESEFGTGCLKITPAHAQDDFTIMNEWNSQQSDSNKKISYCNVIEKDLTLTGPTPAKYKVKKYKDILAELIEDLKTAGNYLKEENIKQNILISERTKAVVEPIMSAQWFISIDKIRQPVIDMVKNGEVNIHPKNMESKFFFWMENLKDWAISRTLWWGYRMPVWYAGKVEEQIDLNGKVETFIEVNNQKTPLDLHNDNHMKVQIDSPGEGWIQEESVLDTWFSSGQWPYATLEAFDLMDTFYPTTVMETGFDILENWVSRMMMFSYFKLKQKPFTDVYLHGLVNGPDGQKMSKSKGNVISMDDAVTQYGTDSLRMVYFYQNSAGSSYSLTFDKLKNFKQFNNKIWNASKFVLGNSTLTDEKFQELDNKFKDKVDSLHPLVQEIYKSISELKDKITKNLNTFEFGYASDSLYQKFWHEFCDVYIESTKKYFLNKEVEETFEIDQFHWVMIYSLRQYIKMLHPFIPFITERIWTELPKEKSDHQSIMYSRW